MADSPPPKKIGSLRDRIAAFENKGPAPTPAAPPVPRPKPAGASWKPRQPSPPPPAAAESDEHADKKAASGMSAADAKESIARGGSLKERMAALQGRTAFAGPPSVPPPRPSSDKPKWKPPPPVASPPANESDAPGADPAEHATSPPAEARPRPTEEEDAVRDVPSVETTEEPDEEDEERQRRAAIAARMARLGGARVGAPPIFGRKPEVKKPEARKEEDHKPEHEGLAEDVSINTTEGAALDAHEPPADITSPPAEESQERSDAHNVPTPSLLSPDIGETASAPRSPAMPVPAVPRRAAPPRKKTPKSPSPAPAAIVLDAQTTESPSSGTPQETSDEKSKELQADVQQSKLDEDTLDLSPALPEATSDEVRSETHPTEEPVDKVDEVVEHADEDTEHSAHAEEPTFEEHEAHEEREQHEEPEEPESYDQTEGAHESPADESVPATSEDAPAEPKDEEDDTARRNRIAERLRQQGGFNPFAAPPPIRRASIPVADVPVSDIETGAQFDERPVELAAAPLPPTSRRESLRQASTDSGILPTSVGIGRRSSVQSVRSNESIPTSPPPVPSATKPFASGRRSSSASVTNAEQEHEQEQEQEGSDLRRTVLSENISEEPSENVSGVSVHEEYVVKHPSEYVHAPEQDLDEEEPDVQSYVAYHAEDEHEDVHEQARDLPTQRAAHEHVHFEEPKPFTPVRRPSSSKRASLPPPPRAIPPAPQVQPVVPPVPSPAARRSLPPMPVEPAESTHHGVVPSSFEAPPPVIDQPSPARRQSIRRSLPPPPPVIPEETVVPDHDIPVPIELTRSPTRRLSTDLQSPRRSLPPPPPPLPVKAVPETEDTEEEAGDVATDPSDYSEDEMGASMVDPGTNHGAEQEHVYGALRIQTEQAPSDSEHEVLDDSDVDPIDPAFYSPQKTSSSVSLVPNEGQAPAPDPEAVAEPGLRAELEPPRPEEDDAQRKRRTIAERMAKLGGIQFGAPLPIGRPPPPPPPAVPEGAPEPSPQTEEPEHVEEPTEEPEEDEAARRQRIAARLAATGGMRFGMFAPAPVSPTAPSPARASHHQEESDAAPPPLPPPRSARRIPTAPQQQDESEAESEDHSASDVVQVEAEESELEEVTHHDVEEEAPPPVPSRQGRLPSVRSPSIPRPPVPTIPPIVPPPTTRPSLPSAVSHGDFVMVEEADAIEVPPQLPPPRTASLKKPPPNRTGSRPPLPPVPASEMSDSFTSQLESSLDFGGDADLSLSGQWSEDSTVYPQPSAEPKATSSTTLSPPATTGQLSADALMAQWGRVGVQIHEIATTLYEKSRKSIIGDRTYVGFINAVLNMVPNASKPTPPFDTFGYLIYEQNGATVLKHASDIMPGDIIVLRDARLKGHKGLHIYQQSVGAGDSVCGIIGDFEMKKSKVKAFQSNQHVGQESVESVSYRLEDLKSGSIKIFRVLEA